MLLNRRDFLKGSGAVWGTAVMSAGLSTLTAQEGSVAEAAGPAPMYSLRLAHPRKRGRPF